MGSIQNKKLYFFLVSVDLILASLCFGVAFFVRFQIPSASFLLMQFMDPQFLGVLTLLVLCNFIFDLYETRYWINPIFSPLRIGLSTAVTGLIVVLWIYAFAAESTDFRGRGVLFGSIAGYFLCSLIFRWLVQSWNRRRIEISRWLFVGPEAYKVAFEEECSASGCLLNYVWVNSEKESVLKKLQDIVTSGPVRGIVVCGAVKGGLTSFLMDARLKGLRIYDFQYFYERVWGKVVVQFLNPNWFIFTSGFSVIHVRTTVKVKAFVDFFVAGSLLLLSLPVLLIVGLAIRLESPGSPIYRQKRVGLNGKVFTMFKLRSMGQDAEAKGAQWAQAGDVRVTRIGRFIRLTRLDELPQLVNILRGEMSFIGPRPERPEFTKQLAETIPFYNQRHLVKPGLTGWAQVVYSYGASEEDAIQKLQYELFYIKNQSIWLDILILFKTFVVVLFGKGR